MDDTTKKIITAPFRLAWGVTKFTGKVAFTVADALLTGGINRANEINHQAECYSGYSDQKLESIAKDESRSSVDRVAAVKNLKDRK